MRTMKFIFPAVLLVMLAIACNRAASSENKADSVMLTREEQEIKDSPTPPQNSGRTTGTDQTPGATNADWDKKIIKQAEMSLETNNFRLYTERLHEKVKAAGGYIAKETQASNEIKIENTVSIKVPVDRFDEMLMQLPSDSDRLISKQVSSEDVTMQLVDTRSQLETKKEVRSRYLELLRQAHSMKDILTVQNEINDIQGQMDGAAGRIAYLSHASAYSTINLTFYQLFDATVKNNPEPGFLHKIGDAFRDGWNWVSLLMIGLVNLWPLLLALIAVWAWWRKRRMLVLEKK